MGRAAGTAGVDAWMVFYASDAIVLLPKGQLASGKELVRQSVTRLLAQSHFAVAWHPIKLEMARSGDLAFVSSAYELRFSDARGMAASDRGRRIEIWRKQADGPWKCIVDTWSSDESAAAREPLGAPSASADGTSATAVTPVSPAPPVPPAYRAARGNARRRRYELRSPNH